MQQTTPSPLFLSCAKHPYCQTCGWRKGGPDSWNGRACKCGDYAPPMRPLDQPGSDR